MPIIINLSNKFFRMAKYYNYSNKKIKKIFTNRMLNKTFAIISIW